MRAGRRRGYPPRAAVRQGGRSRSHVPVIIRRGSLNCLLPICLLSLASVFLAPCCFPAPLRLPRSLLSPVPHRFPFPAPFCPLLSLPLFLIKFCFLLPLRAVQRKTLNPKPAARLPLWCVTLLRRFRFWHSAAGPIPIVAIPTQHPHPTALNPGAQTPFVLLRTPLRPPFVHSCLL